MKFIALLFLVGAFSAYGQHYEPLSSKGKPPASFTTPIKTLLKESKKNSTLKKKKDKKIEKQLNGIIYYQVSEMMASGKVLYGEETYEYLNDLMDKILKKNRIRQKIKVHGFKSSFTNAFATDVGILFVNLGMLSKISNESELAFVLCHELSHYMLKHSLQSELIKYDQSKIADKKGVTAYDKLVQKHAFSQKFELQADSLGLIYFQNAGFKGSLAPDMFEILKDRHYIREDINLNNLVSYDFLIDAHSKSKQDSIKSLFEIKEKAYNDKFSTHPNITARLEQLEKLLPAKPKGKKKIGNKKLLRKAIQVSDLENLRVSLLEENYLESIYYAEKVVQGKEFHEYGYTGFLRANIGLFLSKIYDGNINPRFYYKKGLTDYELLPDSPYTDILTYFRLSNYKEITSFIQELITRGLADYPESEEIKAINNWFIKWTKEEGNIELTDYTPELSVEEQDLPEVTFEYDKKFLLAPKYMVSDIRKDKGQIKVDLVEKNQIKFYKSINNKDRKDQLVDVSLGDRTKVDEQKLQYTGIINTRINEIFASPLNVPLPPVDYYVIKDMCNEHNTERVVFSEGITVFVRKNPMAYAVAIIPYAWPFLAYYMVKPTAVSYFYYNDIDLFKGTYSKTYDISDKSKTPKKIIQEIYLPKN